MNRYSERIDYKARGASALLYICSHPDTTDAQKETARWQYRNLEQHWMRGGMEYLIDAVEALEYIAYEIYGCDPRWSGYRKATHE